MSFKNVFLSIVCVVFCALSFSSCSNPKEAEELYQLAIDAESNGYYSGAVDLLEKAANKGSVKALKKVV